MVKKFNVRQVEAFRAVVAMGSMSKAAELLGISQPAVSRLVGDFQEAVGFRLFKRLRNGAEPTPDARQLFEQVEKLFVGLEELNHQITAIKNLYTGHITISATSSYATGMLPTIIAEFKRMHPSIGVSVNIHTHEMVVDWVAAGRSDIGLTSQPVANADLDVRQLVKRPAICIFPTGHALAAKDELHPSDLAGLPFVSFPRGSPLRFQIDGIFDRFGVERVLQVDTTSHHAVCSLVAAGLGVALVNPFSPYLAEAGRIESRPISPSVSIELEVLWKEPSLSIVTREFRDFLFDYVVREGIAPPEPAPRRKRAGTGAKPGATDAAGNSST